MSGMYPEDPRETERIERAKEQGDMEFVRRGTVALEAFAAFFGSIKPGDYVWLGDLSGFTILGGYLTHRCGWKWWLHDDEYLANITDMAMAHRKAGCA